MSPKKRRRQAKRVSGPQHVKNVKYGRQYRKNRAQVLGRSRQCGLRLPGCTGFAVETDHVLEVSLGGQSSVDNLVPACRNCNQKKKHRAVGQSGRGVPSALELDGFTGGCASDEGGPHDLSRWGGPVKCWGHPGHASRDWAR
jgi:5-methylcytosine-specific restriction endonuclease McrA